MNVADDEPPAVESHSAGTMVPPDAPISFTATVSDNCPTPTVAITGYDCYKFKKDGSISSKLDSCVVAIAGDTITIVDSGGVGDNIVWDILGTDGSGNDTGETGTIEVLNPGGGGDAEDSGNQGVGNGPEGADPGNSNQGDDANSNDENGGTPGNPGKKGGKK